MRQLGKPPALSLLLNPYQDVQFTSRPQSGNQTRQRKFPLFIHVDPIRPVTLNKTCRYCPNCDLLIAHRNKYQHLSGSEPGSNQDE